MARTTYRVAVVGGGFAGLQAVRTLCAKEVDVTLFEPRQSLVMLPALPDVAGGWVEPHMVATPLTTLLPRNVKHEWCGVSEIDLEQRLVVADGIEHVFDSIIISSGARTAPSPFDQASKKAHTLNSLEETLKLRDDFVSYLTTVTKPQVVIVGGGYTGLELAASLAARAKFEQKSCRITVVEMAAAVLSFVPQRWHRRLMSVLKEAGVEIVTGTQVTAWDGQNVTAGGKEYRDVFFCWAAGSVFSDLTLHGEAERLPDGRLVVAEDLSLAPYPGIFAAGDAAAIKFNGVVFRKAVNFAWYGGAVAGKNVIALLSGRRTKPYRPADLGWAIPLHTTGVGQIGRTIWFGGTFALRVHYLMCGFRSPRFSQKLGFAKIGVTLFKTDKEDNMKKIFWGDTKDANLGLLLMRLFTGGAMLTHGVPKLFFTLDKFTEIVASLNLPMPGFLAFMAALSESLGAALLLLGLCTRPAAALLAITMAVAAFVVHGADPFAQQELALFYLCSSLLFMFKGAGKWSTDALIRR